MKAAQAIPCPVQAASGHMRTISVMAMKFTLVDGAQPVDAHLPQLMPDMLNHIQDQDRYACTLLVPAYCIVLVSQWLFAPPPYPCLPHDACQSC